MTVKNYSIFDGNLTASRKVLNDILCDLYMLTDRLDENDAYRNVLKLKTDSIYNELKASGFYDN